MLSEIDLSPWPPCPAPFNLARHVLEASTERFADRMALQILSPRGAERWSYARLMAAVRGCGTGLLAQGLRPGDRVLMRLGNEVAFPVLFLGAIAAGLVPVPTSAALTEAEITRMAGVVAPALIVAGDGVALPDTLPCPVVAAAEVMGWERLPPCDWDMGDPERLAYAVFTSGTSGRAQAVGHAHRAIWARGMMHRGWEGFTEADRVLHAGAFNWTYTLGTGLLDPWTLGAVAMVPARGVEVAALPLLMKRFDVTVFAAAPGVYRQMLRAPMPALPRLRHGLSAGEAMTAEVRAAWEAATGRPVHEALGMTEVSTYVSGCPDHAARAGSAGWAQPGRHVAVLGEDGLPVPRGAQGVLAVHRTDPGLMLGYLGDAAATAARYRGDWFVTGDLAEMAEDGAIFYRGRGDDLMNAGGFRVSPLEVEGAMASLPGLADCAVTEVEVAAGVRVIGCFYVSDAPLEVAVLHAHAERCLARYKQPRLWVRLDALPRSANNKLNRRALPGLIPKE
ncbi:benzoate--CoA ligase [Tabrizicola sp. TH137]|uniref:class I adenylate-forming enzyme family protein n=1 Tax=Tabrizicola sp. TH137 TaxID=2067452 RepID=UPI000C7E5271|nr:class I adenylate-forming enzyme family protein [Tabrizicola sp. TH137]PLL13243.1 benzoate--CoA ligase [Tabrizicola sp. TH137]